MFLHGELSLRFSAIAGLILQVHLFLWDNQIT